MTPTDECHERQNYRTDGKNETTQQTAAKRHVHLLHLERERPGPRAHVIKKHKQLYKSRTTERGNNRRHKMGPTEQRRSNPRPRVEARRGGAKRCWAGWGILPLRLAAIGSNNKGRCRCTPSPVLIDTLSASGPDPSRLDRSIDTAGSRSILSALSTTCGERKAYNGRKNQESHQLLSCLLSLSLLSSGRA